jgi:dethiobiotin synthetase
MPDTTILVTATGTEVGKTWTIARVAEKLRAAGVEVHARKPVQSFAPGDEATDADILATATGEAVNEVCPAQFHLPIPMAPPMAAAKLGRAPFGIAELVAAMNPPASGILFVEGVGGPRSPLASDGDTIDLARAVEPDGVVIVASPGLGVINDVLLCVGALERRDAVIFLNRFDENLEMHVLNLKWLQETENLTVVTSIDELVASLPVKTPSMGSAS